MQSHVHVVQVSRKSLTWLQVFPKIENGPETNFAATVVVNVDSSQKRYVVGQISF